VALRFSLRDDGEIPDVLQLTYEYPGFVMSYKNFSETRYCGTGARMIQTDDQMLLAQQSVTNLRSILLQARKVHSSQDYLRLAEPILLEVQQREQDILDYLSSGIEHPNSELSILSGPGVWTRSFSRPNRRLNSGALDESDCIHTIRITGCISAQGDSNTYAYGQ
jgi:hypothetical protein